MAYTTFEYGKIELDNAAIKPGGTVTASVKITNTGKRAGTEVAQLYLRSLAGSAGPRPVRELKGFHKLVLQPGETQQVRFTLSSKELGYYDAQGHWVVDPGKYQLWIASNSATGEPVEFGLGTE